MKKLRVVLSVMMAVMVLVSSVYVYSAEATEADSANTEVEEIADVAGETDTETEEISKNEMSEDENIDNKEENNDATENNDVAEENIDNSEVSWDDEGVIKGIPVRHIDDLDDFCRENLPVCAILCIPKNEAEELCKSLVARGVKGFWNFSHCDLSLAFPNVVVENVHLSDSLAKLSYNIKNG